MKRRRRRKVRIIASDNDVKAWDKLLKQMDKMNLSAEEKELIK
jgi:hypothetical protein